MPSIAGIRETVLGLKSDTTADVPTPQKRRLRSNALAAREAAPETPIATPESMRKSPRQCLNSSPTSPANGIGENSSGARGRICNPAVKNLTNEFTPKPNWNPGDMAQMAAVKEALHLSTAPSMVVCREAEQKRIIDFCKGCIERAKSGSLYVCGCPGTGKTLAMEKVRQHLVDWAKEAGFQPPDVLAVNCTSLTNTSEIFSKMIGQNQAKKRTNRATSPLQHLQSLYSQQQAPSGSKMMLIIADELDYLITRDRAVLHDLFMLTTFPSSRCILIGIANAIDLADRFLPRLQSLNCKPVVITFKAYSKDQILRILQERLTALPVTVFHPQALELCARKVAAASGDMRKALCVCRNAIETLEAEIRESANNMDLLSEENGLECQQTTACESRRREEDNVVRIDHMATALSKAYRSRVVDTIQSLPQHQQIILCSAVKSFRGGKKDTTVGELNKSYVDICKFTMIPPVGIMEFSSMCTVLNDQGLIKVGQSRDDKSRRVSLKVDGADIIFALQVPVFFGVIRSAYALRGDLFLKREHLRWHTGAPGLQQRLVTAYTAKKREVNMEVLAANFSARSSAERSRMYELVLHAPMHLQSLLLDCIN